MSGPRRWVMAWEDDGSGFSVTAAVRIGIGQSVSVGRDADLPLGTAVPNARVSRRALTVTATDIGWSIAMTNRNGGMLHPWAQPRELASPAAVLNWPLVAVRVPAEPGACRHWVLLEADDLAVLPGGPRATRTDVVLTAPIRRPGGLTPAEREALETTFPDQLRWPPRDNAEPLLLKQAATRLHLTVSGLQDRLRPAWDRATELGLTGPVRLADPTYLHLLVRAGYLAPPTSFPHRPPPR